MSDDTVLVEVGVGRFRTLPLAEALLAGAKRAGRKKWPSGLSEPLYRLPHAAKKQADDGKRGIGGAKSFLTQRERESLKNFIGVDVADAQDARRKMKERHLRFTEKGEEADETFDALLAASHGDDVGDRLDVSRFDLWGDEARRKPFGPRELRETYARFCQEYGTRPKF